MMHARALPLVGHLLAQHVAPRSWNHVAVAVTKRTLDIFVATIGLIVSAPFMVLIALLTRLDSKGPALFRQVRAGKLTGTDRHGEPQFSEFTIIKFRTMRPDAERETGAVLTRNNDPRITRIGRLLRKTRLDELPQLINILWGDMSLVGPRPERPEILRQLVRDLPFFEERMRNVKPGLTGLAQISLGYSGAPSKGTAAALIEEKLEENADHHVPQDEATHELLSGMQMKLLYDLTYVTCLERYGRYLITELTIIAKTPFVMLFGRGGR